MEKKFKVNIREIYGTCDTDLFKKMIARGDVTSYKAKERVGDKITITGYAYADIETDEKNFSIGYYATDKGFYSTGSEVFLNSVKDYISDCEKFVIMAVDTKRGKTYKAVPVLDFTINDETGEI